MACPIKNNTQYDLSGVEPLAKDLYSFTQKRVGFNRPPTIVFDSDPENAENPLGKTAYYDPSSYKVVVFVDDRHPKDILRSLAHELIHHGQNCRGEFEGGMETGPGYAQKDSHMREMEREAYEQGNLCLRDWEDQRKNSLQETIYYTDRRFGRMSLKEWKNNKINSLLMKKFGLMSEGLGAASDWHDYEASQRVREENDENDEEGEEKEIIEPKTEPPQSPESKAKHKPSEREPLKEEDEVLSETGTKGLRETIHDAINKVLKEKNVAYLRDISNMRRDDKEEKETTQKSLEPIKVNKPKEPASQYPEEVDFSYPAYDRDDDEELQNEGDQFEDLLVQAEGASVDPAVVEAAKVEFLENNIEEAVSMLNQALSGGATEEEPIKEWHNNTLLNKLTNLWAK
tara:strand:+ start:199 stop:1398 length:1200 start_codon:yes stop_codon:yes gene_type:complete